MTLRKSWCKETAHPSYQDGWSSDNPAYGQCLVTCLLMQDIYGGDLYSCKVGNRSHFVLTDENNHIYDPTLEQWGGQVITYSNMRKRDREQLLKNKDVRSRYNLLKERYMEDRS